MTRKSIYSEPLRVYVGLGLLAVIGIFCGTILPVSLFPNSSKPTIFVWSGYGDSTAEEFSQLYGTSLETQLKSLSLEGAKVSDINATYDAGGLFLKATFSWGNSPTTAEKEVKRIVDGWSSRLDERTRNSVEVWLDNESSGFFAASFYSEKRTLDELYDLLEPVYLNKISQVEDASSPELWNPASKEIRLELKPNVLASLQILPTDVARALEQNLHSFDGGSINSGQNRVSLPKSIASFEQLAKIPVMSRTGRIVHLGDIASIDFGLKSKSSRIIKTSGSTSIMVFATPKAGGNIKKMSEDLMKVIKDGIKELPDDVKFKVLVDPSEFIRSSIENVFHEVGIGSLLAVTILFVFIGSFKNVATAAIEIPLSLVLAFILMKLFNVNLNLISLGGLALSAGMNVDASVVVMENIFRHFEEYHGKFLNRAERLSVIVKAVAEVKAPIISSTIASLVVFVPLLLTSDLSYAILGDLAKAVVFSHAFSAGVALLLVPTVRLQLMGDEGVVHPHTSRFEKQLSKMDSFYESVLKKFFDSKKLKWGLYGSILMALPILILLVLPNLPREVIGIPDTDMVLLKMKTKGNSKIRQMESVSDEVEKRLLDKFKQDIDYTFTQIGGANRATIIPRLIDKKNMERVVSQLEKEFVDTPQVKFTVEPFNPSELPIPDPPAATIAVRGGSLLERRDIALDVIDMLEGSQKFNRVTSEPNIERQKGIQLYPNLDQWSQLQAQVTMQEVMAYVRTASEGRWVADLKVKNNDTGIIMRFPDGFLDTIENLEALPIGIHNKLVPLKSLFTIKSVEVNPAIYRSNGDEVIKISGHVTATQKKMSAKFQKEAEDLLNQWRQKKKTAGEVSSKVSVSIEDAAIDITRAIDQLGLAIAASIFLIFIVLLLQFGTIVEPLLILVAVPLGFIGVLIALFVFRSTLSLNSALGVILLNGIAVNNSIILVDFTKRLWEEGLSPLEAALKAAKLRLRPILITSLTSILGMMPVALGLGEGGKILQPLGIAVSGGLWISMLLTLIMVPLLQVSYLSKKQRSFAK